MKHLILSFLCIACSSYASAEKWTYASASKSVVAIEKELMLCAPSPDEAGECYEETIDKYNLIIKDIRAGYSNKVDGKLWQSINLGYKKQIDSCRADFNISSHRYFFFPYQDCVTNLLHNLTITTIELHLR